MAKRKRLTPAQAGFLGGAAPETKSMTSVGGPPIAQVAGDAAALSALREVTEMVETAKAEGRMVLTLPLDAIDADYLVRDRAVVDAEEMNSLVESLKSRGQQTPIEVVALDEGRYGLISGWRRVAALRRLSEETGAARFAEIQALERRPAEASDAYIAMVEENEIRVGLSYFERARIVVRSVERGVFRHERDALNSLFASASRAKRSKIGSFMPVVVGFDGVLKFPAQLPERLGLQIARVIMGDTDQIRRLADRLRKADPQDAEAEMAVLTRALAGKDAESISAAPAAPKPAKTDPSKGESGPSGATEEVASGVFLELGGGYLKPRLTLAGPKVDQAFREDLVAWIRARNG